MAHLVGSHEIQSFRFELAQIGRSIRSSFRSPSSSSRDHDDYNEYEFQWAQVQRLPTFERINTALFDDMEENGNYVKGKRVVNVTKLGADERHIFVEKLIKQIENDNLRLLKKLRHRIDKAEVKLPTVEVRFKNLYVEAKCKLVHGKPLPTLWNTARSLLSDLANLPGSKQEATISILNDASGIIKPGRMTLLLGPPGCGKSTLLLALSGKLSHSLKVTGEITYNGYRLDEFVPQKTSAYTSQYDLHTPEMTVRESLDFSARFQGIGSRAEIMKEVSRREKQAGIIPDPDIDAYMKLVITAAITMTVFHQTRMSVDAIHSSYFMGSLFYALNILVADGFPELSMTVSRIAVFYKQRELCFYPAWAYAIPAAILKVPISLLASFIWTAMTYYVIGYSSEVGRFFRQFLVNFGVHLASISMFRCIASVCQTIVASTTVTSFAIIFVLLFGGFIIPSSSLPSWLGWGFWLSPVTYGEIGLSLNEFLAPRWQKVMSGNTSVGQQTLESRGLNFDGYFYWISIAALFGFILLFNAIFTFALTFLNPPGKSRTMISFERYAQLQREDEKDSLQELKGTVKDLGNIAGPITRQMVLPFEPLTVTFQDVQYYLDTPQLVLLKTGGQIIYSGPLGQNSRRVIEYFQVTQLSEL
ncbi:hypothetical protein V6N13_034014 [Hibiscus sabdariffa]